MRTTELTARLKMDASQFNRSVKEAEKGLQDFSRVSQALPGGQGNIFASLARDASAVTPVLSSLPLGIAAVAAGLATLGVRARSAGQEFETALAKIKTLGADAQASIGQTRDAILSTFTSVGVTGGVQDLAEANYLLQSSGRSAAEAVADLDVAARASVAGFTSTATAVDGLTTVTAAWRDSALSTATASDVMFQSVNLGKATFDQIAQSIGLVAPLAASAGVSFEEVSAATAVLSNQGVRTSSVMEGLRSAIINIQRPTQDFKKNYGALAQEFDAARLKQDGLIKFLQDFSRESGGSSAALQALFTDATAQVAVNGLLANGGNDVAKAFQAMASAAGSTDRALAEVAKTSEYQEQLLRNQLSASWTEFGELLNRVTLPILTAVARAINDISDGAAFAKSDVQELVRLSGTESQPTQPGKDPASFAQVKALRRVVAQFTDNPKQFLSSLSRDELEQLGGELVRLRASNRYTAKGTVITADFINAVVDERLKRDEQASRDSAAAVDAKTTAATTAKKMRTESEAERETQLAAQRAERQRDAAKREADRVARERQKLIDDAASLTEQLETAALAATQGTIGALQAAMEKTLAEGARRLASGVLSPDAAAALRFQLEQFEQLQTEMIGAEQQAQETQRAIEAAMGQEQAPALQAIAARERELTLILDGTTNLEARKKIEEQLTALAKARGDLTEGVFVLPEKPLKNTIELLGDLAQSIATVGDQLGLLPRRAVDAIRGIGALAEQGSKLASGWGSLSTLGKAGATIGIVGGIASLASSLFGPTAEDTQRREELKKNTDALRELSSRVGDLAASSVGGRTIGAVRNAVEGIAAGLPGGTRGTIADLDRFIARSAGVTVRELRQLAEDLGITINDTAQSLFDLRDALREDDLKAYSNTFAGAMQQLQDTITADGITDAIEILRRRVATLSDAKTGFPALADALQGVDLTTTEGRADALTRTRALFEQVRTGTLDLSRFGQLSIADARQALLDLITALRGTTSSDPAGTGGFNESRTITEVTGSRLAGLIGTGNTFLASIAADARRLADAFTLPSVGPLAPPSLPAGFGGGASRGGVVFAAGAFSIPITVTVTGGDLAGASSVGERVGAAAAAALVKGLVPAIDQALGQVTAERRVLIGDPRVLLS